MEEAVKLVEKGQNAAKKSKSKEKMDPELQKLASLLPSVQTTLDSSKPEKKEKKDKKEKKEKSKKR